MHIYIFYIFGMGFRKKGVPVKIRGITSLKYLQSVGENNVRIHSADVQVIYTGVLQSSRCVSQSG